MKKIIYSIALISPLLFCSCEQEEVKNSVQTQEIFSNWGDFISTKEVKSIETKFTNEDGLVLSTEKGSKITIPADVIVFQNGDLVSGEIELKFKEIFSNSDIIFSEVFPIGAGDKVLNSGGEFFIGLEQESEKLKVKDGETITVEIPAQAEDPNMQLFFAGDEEVMEAVNWGDAVQWGTSNSFSFSSGGGTYICNIDSIGWANIDAFYDTTIYSYFDINFNCVGVAGINNSNTSAYAVFKGKNSVWPTGSANWGSISNNTIFETHLANVPMNLLVISVIDEQLYYGLLDVTPVKGEDYEIKMNKITSAALDDLINSLP